MYTEVTSSCWDDYLGGQTQGAEAAWQISQEAISVSKDPHATMCWVGKHYAAQGYFAESVDMLEEPLRKYPDQDARRLWVEVSAKSDSVDSASGRWESLSPQDDGNRSR